MLIVDEAHATPMHEKHGSLAALVADDQAIIAGPRATTRIGLPTEAESAALYVVDLRRRGRRPATIGRELVAIAVYHLSMDHPTPTGHDVVRTVKRGNCQRLGIALPQKTVMHAAPVRC
jgi:hypothetical protein